MFSVVVVVAVAVAAPVVVSFLSFLFRRVSCNRCRVPTYAAIRFELLFGIFIRIPVFEYFSF